MADSREEITEMIRTQLQRSNPPDTEALYGRAVQIDDSVQDLTLRQFNAKYILQVKRKMKKDEEPETETETEGSRREAIRKGLLRFAHDVAGAEDKAELIEVLNSVEDYVDEVAEALDL